MLDDKEVRALNGFVNGGLLALYGIVPLLLRRLPEEDVRAIAGRVADGEVSMQMTTAATGTQMEIIVLLHDLKTGQSVKLMHERLQPEETKFDLADSNEVDKLGQLLDGLKNSSVGDPIPPLTREWAIAGIEAAVRKGDSLDASLGLSGRGKRSLQNTLDTLNRDVHLIRALQHVAVDDGATAWDCCTRLAEKMDSFSQKWKRSSGLSEPPESWEEWDKCLFLAARCAHGSTASDHGLPATAAGLLKVANRDSGYSVTGAAATVLAKYRNPVNS